jgi:hypothetical protein
MSDQDDDPDVAPPFSFSPDGDVSRASGYRDAQHA